MVDTVAGDISTTDTLTLGTPTKGTIEKVPTNDHDWYRITLVAGQTYTFTVDGSSTATSAGTNLSDSLLVLRDGAGNAIRTNDDGGQLLYSQITFTATTSGTYYLDVSGVGGDVGDFQVLAVNASASGADTVGGHTGAATTITVGSTVNGAINTIGDHDYYAVTLTAGQRYSFTTSSTGAAGDVDSYIFLRDAAGNILAQNDDSNGTTYSSFGFTVSTTGTYYVDVEAYGNSSTGAYRLNVNTAPPLTMWTTDQIASQLIGTGTTASRFNITTGGTLTVNLTALSAAGQNLARHALEAWSDVTGINFSEVTTSGQITFIDTGNGGNTSTTTSGAFITSATVNVSSTWLTDYGSTLNSYSYQAYIHEIGHALGLNHPGDYNLVGNFNSSALYLNDAWSTSIMSYFSQTQNTFLAGLGFTREFVVTPMVADIVAVQRLYGAYNGGRTADTVYGFGSTTGRDVYDATLNPGVSYTVYDNGGTDTLNYSGFSQAQWIDLRQEAFSNIGGLVGNVTIARGSVIENATGGSGADIIVGNDTNNTLNGGGGIDKLYGGLGNDTYIVDVQGDLVFENANEGTDTVQSSSNFYLYANIENLTLTGAADNFGVGNELANVITGNSGANLLIAGAGDDTVNGGDGNDRIFGEDGIDTLNGEGGNDYIVAGNGNDLINGGAGDDEVYGQLGDDQITGGLGADMLVGGDGNDTLFGNSGSGEIDRLYGQAGDDTFYVDARGDLVFEQPGEGTDTVFADINGDGFYLYANIENLTLLGATTYGVGNELDNVIIGNAGGNSLLGGAGNDTINGKAGADTLWGQAGTDTFVFDKGTGADVIGDFERGVDKIDLRAFTTLTTFAAVQALFAQNGANGTINLGGGDSVTLNGVTLSQLTAADFLLAPAAIAPLKEPTLISKTGFGPTMAKPEVVSNTTDAAIASVTKDVAPAIPAAEASNVIFADMAYADDGLVLHPPTHHDGWLL